MLVSSRTVRRALGLLSLGTVSIAPGAAGCLSRPLEPIKPRITQTITEVLPQSRVDKIDLLLAIDNSGSMADKQKILATAVPDLVSRLVNPLCVDADGVPAASQPPSLATACADGFDREFDPIDDIHIGIISSSLGSPGGAACDPTAEWGDPSMVDMAHLVDRTASGAAPTWDGKGFLAWDPNKKQTPAGTSEYAELESTLRDMVVGVGQVGCGYEAQLESWYRFLVDPEPYATIEIDGDAGAVLTGVDQVLLEQRADFLRPDSLLAIVMLTDENDCSADLQGAGYLMNKAGQMWRPRKECATDPNDPCCKSCKQDPGECPHDATCFDGEGEVALLSTDEDDKTKNLRCFEQKRRFGFDMLFPIQRYVDGLRETTVPGRDGTLLPNPIFSDLSPGDQSSTVRTQHLVFFAGIVGVPWQDIARDPTDLANGGFKNHEEMAQRDAETALTAWDLILGDPAKQALPADALMRESIDPRLGFTHPITGEATAPAGAARDANLINGHEYNVSDRDDLQYACVFDLEEPRDCTATTTSGALLHPNCECLLKAGETPESNGNPLCQDASGNYTQTQYRAKAYPGVRQLGVLKELGEQGIVASVCPSFLTSNPTPEELLRADYGYRPAVASIIDRLKQALIGQCLPRTLDADEAGQVSCLILEARKVDGECSCDGAARDPVSAEHQPAVDQALENPAAAEAGWNCFCEIPQLTGAELEACQTQTDKSPSLSGEPIDGWCYVDPGASPIANPELVKDCKSTEKRKIRFVGEAQGSSGSTMFITCSGE